MVEERSIFRGGGVGSASDSDSSSDDTEAAETNEISQMKGLDYSMMVCRLENIHYSRRIHVSKCTCISIHTLTLLLKNPLSIDLALASITLVALTMVASILRDRRNTRIFSCRHGRAVSENMT